MGSRCARVLACVMVIFAGLTLSACGSDDDDGGSATAAHGGNASEAVATAQERLDALFAGESFSEPPATAPKAEPGKNVWLVDFGLAAPAGAIFAETFEHAAKQLEWRPTIFDGQFSSDRYQAGIRQAIADKADAIVLYNVDCALVKGAMEQARSAGITLYSAESADCTTGDSSAGALFDGNITYDQGSWTDYAKALGAAQADYVIAKTKGDAKIILFYETDLITTTDMYRGFLDELKMCSTCEVVETVKFLATDAGPKLQEKTQQALLHHPDANAVVVPIDDFMTAGISAAIMASGRNDQLLVVAGGGLPANMDLIREDRGEDAGYGISIGWEAYAALDGLNRMFNGGKPEDSGIGLQMIDREHNVPEKGIYEPPVDFARLYEKAWAEGTG